MVSTGWKIAGAGSQIDASDGVSHWSNTSNITDTSSSSAETTMATTGTKTSHYLVATNFGFLIPTGATISGIEARVEWNSGSGGVDYEVILLVGGVPAGANKGTNSPIPGSRGTSDYGAALDLWSISPTPSQINSADFGLAIRVRNSGTSKTSKVHVYTSWLNVHYEEPEGGFYERVAGTWRKGQLYERVAGVYRPGKLYERIGGIWRS